MTLAIIAKILTPSIIHPPSYSMDYDVPLLPYFDINFDMRVVSGWFKYGNQNQN